MSNNTKDRIALRPKEPAIRGKIVEVIVNYVQIQPSFKYPTVHSYTLEVTNQQRKKAKREDTEAVFYHLYNKKEFGQNAYPVYDGSMIYSAKKLCNEKDYKKFPPIDLPPQDGAGRAKRFFAVLKYSQTCDTYQMADYIKENTRQRWGEDIQNCLRILNAFINSEVRAKPQYLTHGRRQIFPKPSSENRLYLPGGIELMLGFCQSIRGGWEKLLINVDVCATTFYPFGPLINFLPKILGKKSKDDLLRGLSPDEIKFLEILMKDKDFTTTYRSANNSLPKKKVSYITSKSADQCMFEFNGKKNSVSEYFRDSGTPLEYSKLPCIVVKAAKRGQNDSFYPLEVCSLISGQKFKVDYLNREQRKDMIDKASVYPGDRLKRITGALDNVYKHSQNEAMKSIGMLIDSKLMKIKSRVLDPPKIIVENQETIPKSGAWNVPKFFKGEKLSSWAVVCFDPNLKNSRPVIDKAIASLREVMITKGMNVTNNPLKFTLGNPQNCKQSLSTITLDLKNAFPKEIPLIICILASKVHGISGLYAAIKKICIIELGVNSQCFQSKEIGGHLWKSICNNVALKINGKLGGVNSHLAPKQLDFKGAKGHMVIGADVFHPSNEDKKKGRPSVAGIVASTDEFATRYSGRYSMNKKLKNEVIEDINEIIIDFVKLYNDVNESFPEAILFYRDGVAEGQFEIIMEDEVDKILAALKTFYKSRNLQPPKLTFVIMQKRHHTRAKPTDESNSDPKGHGNCQPGTIIDKDIVVPQYFTFFLQSHSSPLGTARPAYYHVIYDELNFSQDEMQTITYNLCFSSARCNLSLSMVTPLHYAHNLANLAKNFVTYKEIPAKAKPANRGGRSAPALAPTPAPEYVQNGKAPPVNDNILNKMYFA